MWEFDYWPDFGSGEPAEMLAFADAVAAAFTPETWNTVMRMSPKRFTMVEIHVTFGKTGLIVNTKERLDARVAKIDEEINELRGKRSRLAK